MVVKVAMADHFQFKVMPSIKNFCLLKQGDVHYIGGTDILPAPLGASEERPMTILTPNLRRQHA